MTEVPPKKAIPFNILYTVDTWRTQNGIRNDDYERYRNFCRNKVKGLRKSLKVQNYHRNKTFRLQKVNQDKVTNERFFHIDTLNCERAYMHSIELKQSYGEFKKKSIYTHYMSRFKKAINFCKSLYTLVQNCCDDLSVVEFEIYYNWIFGLYHIEKEDYSTALQHLNRCEVNYSILFSSNNKIVHENALIYNSILDKIRSSIKLCSFYNNLLQNKSQKDGANSNDGGNISNDNNNTLSGITCLYNKHQIKITFFPAVLFLEKYNSIRESKDPINYLELLNEFDDLLKLISNELRKENINPTDVESLRLCQSFLLYSKYLLQIDQNNDIIASLNKKRRQKPLDYVKLYDDQLKLLSLVKTLYKFNDESTDSTTNTHIQGVDGKSQRSVDDLHTYYKSYKLYYCAKSYAEHQKYNEAIALLDKVLLLMGTISNTELDTDIKQLKVKLQVVSSDDFPPNYQKLPPKPVFFDLAESHLSYPSINPPQIQNTSSGSGVGGWFSGWFSK